MLQVGDIVTFRHLCGMGIVIGRVRPGNSAALDPICWPVCDVFWVETNRIFDYYENDLTLIVSPEPSGKV